MLVKIGSIYFNPNLVVRIYNHKNNSSEDETYIQTVGFMDYKSPYSVEKTVKLLNQGLSE